VEFGVERFEENISPKVLKPKSRVHKLSKNLEATSKF
jgi:hypothetical protein